jgi:hypothetical protein
VLLVLGGTVTLLLRRKIVFLPPILPYLGFTLYSMVCGFLGAFARGHFGSDQALSSRYCTLTVPLWSSLIFFLSLLGSRVHNVDANLLETAIAEEPRRAPAQTLARAMLALSVCLLAVGSLLALPGVAQMSRRQAEGRRALLQLANRPGTPVDYGSLSLLYPYPHIIVERAPFLIRNHWTVFRDQN